ncbi:bacterio-opsin activator domain-containing protein [Haloterrigena alkaliphila]|uniref:bacterio-opsin activator domain-containing protein n=1 Tax=Haloterrigena alkaliphila TaxID=2816475 RepID=UPI001CFF5CDE|nr:bacterio-opsin activator domain-containing protein [Haloterrigena alkaliphila]UHQ95344.1 helix-turn-helix domain-containing protein [Haloterrigena alkaliphila]
MSDGSVTVADDVCRVLVVGDERPADVATDALSSQLESVSIVRERSLSGAVDRLSHLDIHCVVCPFEPANPESSPLERLRERDAELPILAVLEGSSTEETVAAALEAGADDVVAATDPRSLIAARVSNAAERHRLATLSARPDRSILERSDALVWVVDDEGTVAYASSAVEARMGYTPDELERTSLSRFVHPDDRETIAETLETVSAGPVGTTERVSLRLGHTDGTWHRYELTCTDRLADPVVEGIVLTLSPSVPASTEGDRALDRVADPVLTLGPQGELRYANAAAVRLFDGETPESGTVVWNRLDDAVRGQFYERVREARTTDRTVEFEIALPALEDQLLVSVYPGEEGVTVHAREAPSEASAADRERFDLLEEVVNTLGDGIAVLEGSTVRYANAELFELTDAETLVGRDVDAVFDDELAAAIRERAGAPVVRWMDPLSGTLADDGPAVDVFVAPLSAAGRTLCVVRDSRRSASAALSTAGRTIATMRDADSPAAVRRAAVDGALACTDADLAGWYLLEDDALRPAAVETARATGPVDLPAIDRDETDLLARLEATDGDGSGAVFDRSELDPLLARAGIRAERVFVARAGDHGLLLATSTEPRAFGERDRLPLETVVDAAALALDALECESTVRTYRADLDRLEAVVDRCRRLRAVERTLLEGGSRAEIERELCEALVSLPFDESTGTIGLAWVGTVTTGGDRLTSDTWAGRDGDSLESVSVAIEPDDESAHPAARAATTLEPAVVADLEAGEADRAWQRRAVERGFRSAMSLPLVVDEFCYGTLTVYADRPSAFDDTTRTLLEHLATVAGHAIAGVERKRALLSERVTELEVVLQETDEPLSALARRLDRSLDVGAVVPRSSGGSTVFCTAGDVTEAAIDDAVESLPGVESGRLVGDRGEASLLEFVLAETLAETLADHGGVLRSVTPVDDRTRLVVDLSSTVDVRSFVRLIERRQPGARLVARRERDRSVRPARAFDAELRSQLSERQLRTLETAYYGGFFEWPRESTGEEVADSLGVSQPTFSRHLRLAQRKAFALLFEERAGAGQR